MIVRPLAAAADMDAWTRLRAALWPHCAAAALRTEGAHLLTSAQSGAVFLAKDGCESSPELASDAELANAESNSAHAAPGFKETGRIVCFRKALGAWPACDRPFPVPMLTAMGVQTR